MILKAAPGAYALATPDGAEAPAAALALATPQGPRAEVFLAGRSASFALPDPFAKAEEAVEGGDAVTAPMPGLLKRLAVAAGDAITAGQTLAVMEAMKMEHRLLAPRDGTVARTAEEGASVAEGTVLVALEPEAAEAPADPPAPDDVAPREG